MAPRPSQQGATGQLAADLDEEWSLLGTMTAKARRRLTRDQSGMPGALPAMEGVGHAHRR